MLLLQPMSQLQIPSPHSLSKRKFYLVDEAVQSVLTLGKREENCVRVSVAVGSASVKFKTPITEVIGSDVRAVVFDKPR